MPDLSAIGLEQGLAIGSALVAVVSFLFNWVVVSRQIAMQAESLKAQMDADLLHWAHDAVDALSAAAHVARSRGAILDEASLRREAALCASRLSAIADKGRLFFPNIAPDAAGQHREGAFRGYRPPVLDALVFACQRIDRIDVRNLGPDDEAAQFLVRCRRLLVSEVQRAVDPRRRGKMLRRLAKSSGEGPSGFREAAALGNDLEALFPGALIEPRDEDWIAARERMARS